MRKVLGAGEGGIVILLIKEFLVLVGLSLVVAFVTVGYQTVVAAKANPVKALREGRGSI